MAFAEINGQRIRYEDSGGDGPPVILAHGFLMDREMFAPQVQALSPEFRVITWDERGFGETEFDGKPFTYWDSAARLPGAARPPRDRPRGRGRDVAGRLPVAARRAHGAGARSGAGIDRHPGRGRGPAAAARLSPDAADLAGGRAGGRARADDREPDHRRRRSSTRCGSRSGAASRPRACGRPPTACSNGTTSPSRLGEIDCPALVIHGTADMSIEMPLAEQLARACRAARAWCASRAAPTPRT